MHRALLPIMLGLALTGSPAAARPAADGTAHAPFVALDGGGFRSVLAWPETAGIVMVAPFALQERPVSNAEFAAFVEANPHWRREAAMPLFADAGYLDHFTQPGHLNGLPAQPVTRVSWFAASAYCESIDARLPTWAEWEYAAAADATRRDARQDPAWRMAILNWYARPSGHALPEAGSGPPNAHGVRDLHGLVWEWVEDYASLTVSADNRAQGDPSVARFCGAGALSTSDRDNYPTMMRVAMLSALQGETTTRNLGFRCARDLPEGR